MNTHVSFISSMINIYSSPVEIFRTLKNQSNFLYPLLLITLCNAVILSVYFSWVDFNWLQEQIILMSGPDLSASEQKQMREAMSFMTPVFQGALTIVATSVSLLLFSSLYSLYLMVISMIVNDSNRFKNWFSVIWWSYLPILFSTLATTIKITLAQNNQLGLDQLNPLTINNLFFHLGFESSLKPLLDSLDITLFWTIGLLVLGYKIFTNKSWTSSTIIILFPFVLVYGIWLLMAF